MKIGYLTQNIDEVEFVSSSIADATVIPLTDFSTETFQEHNDIEVLSVFVDNEVTKDIIDSLPNLKHILTRSTGYDHIDIPHAKQRGITVSNVPLYGSQTVAEYTFALILELSRKVGFIAEHFKERPLQDVNLSEGFDLERKTLGIIGTGSIGKHVAQIASGFSMNIIAHDLYPDEDWSKSLGIRYTDLTDLLKESNIISLNTPASPAGGHLLGRDEFTQMREGVHIINTARGELIDTQALIEALESGPVAGAALDVFEGEETMKGNEALNPVVQKLLTMNNVIVTPHIAFNTKEAKERIIETTITNIKACISGSPINTL